MRFALWQHALGLACTTRSLGTLASPTRLLACRILREGLTNADRHALGGPVTIDFKRDETRALLTIDIIQPPAPVLLGTPEGLTWTRFVYASR